MRNVFGHWRSNDPSKIALMVRSIKSINMVLGLVAHVRMLRKRDSQLCIRSAERPGRGERAGCDIPDEMPKRNRNHGRSDSELVSAKRLRNQSSRQHEGSTATRLVLLSRPGFRYGGRVSIESQAGLYGRDDREHELRRRLQPRECGVHYWH